MPSSLGGGGIVVLAAMIWIAWSAPSWRRRRHFLAAEREAVRLQRALQAPAGHEVSEGAGGTAFVIAEQHRLLRGSAHRAERLARRRDAAVTRGLKRSSRAPREPRRRAAAIARVHALRLRRSRVLAILILLASTGTIGWGLRSGPEDRDWWALGGGIVGVLLALAVLQRAATVAAAHRVVDAVHAAVLVRPAADFDEWVASAADRPVWSSVPLAHPPGVGVLVPGEPALTRLATEPSEPSAVRSGSDPSGADARTRWAAMGLVQTTDPVHHDLDAVLRRRAG